MLKVFVEVLQSNQDWLLLFKTKPTSFIAGLAEGGVVLVDQIERADLIVATRESWRQEYAHKFVLSHHGDRLWKLDYDFVRKVSRTPIVSPIYRRLKRVVSYYNHMIYSDRCMTIAARHDKKYDLLVGFGMGEPGTDKFNHRSEIFEVLHEYRHDPKCLVLTEAVSDEEYCEMISKSKLVVSPYGHTQLCGRDYQAAYYDCILLKPYGNYICYPDPTLGAIRYAPDNIHRLIHYGVAHYDQLLARIYQNNEYIRSLARSPRQMGTLNALEFHRYHHWLQQND